MRSVLVTGGAGFIGGNFVRYWVERHPQDRLVVLDALTYAGNLQTLADLITAESVVFQHGDILDTPLVAGLFSEYATDTVVHFAAESHVDRSISDPAAFV